MAKFIFRIYWDGGLVGECAANKKDARRWIKQSVPYTHMGEWRRVNGMDWHYYTTIGRTYTFMRSRVA